MTCRSITGLVIGFVYGWQLALVIFAVSPLLVASATVMFKVIYKLIIRLVVTDFQTLLFVMFSFEIAKKCLIS